VRDRTANGLTPFTSLKSGAASDADLTRRIRRALVQDKYLSTLAKKIITKDGSVTLRAPVRTQQGTTIIARNDRQVAGADRVDDQRDILHR
jgi:osmotically-inducible protein OsmY